MFLRHMTGADPFSPDPGSCQVTIMTPFISRLCSFVLLFATLAGLLGACGDSSTPADPGWPGYIEGPNEGLGWLGFTYPYGPIIETTDPFVEMGGTTFIPAVAACPGGLGPDYQVSWYNDANGLGGPTDFGLNCLVLVYAWWEVPLGLIPLEPGANTITITSDDGLGNIGRASMTVIRN